MNDAVLPGEAGALCHSVYVIVHEAMYHGAGHGAGPLWDG